MYIVWYDTIFIPELVALSASSSCVVRHVSPHFSFQARVSVVRSMLNALDSRKPSVTAVSTTRNTLEARTLRAKESHNPRKAFISL